MSLSSLFGKKKKKAAPPSQTIQNLQGNIDLLNKKVAHLQTKINNEKINAKKYASRNKRAAMMALKRKKLYEGQMQKLEGTIFSLEQQKIAIEGLSTNMEVINAMTQAKDTMKDVNKNMTIDDVDDVMDDIKEQMEVADEISTALSEPMSNDVFDEQELEDELAELEDENIDEMLTGTKAPVTALPQAPQTAVPQAKLDEEAEFAALEAEMN